jgi:hypothetical protein
MILVRVSLKVFDDFFQCQFRNLYTYGEILAREVVHLELHVLVVVVWAEVLLLGLTLDLDVVVVLVAALSDVFWSILR